MFAGIGSHSEQAIADEIVDLFAVVHEEREKLSLSADQADGVYLVSTFADFPLQKPSVALVERVRKSPVQEAAKWAVRCVGYQLYDKGGIDLMMQVSDLVTEASPRAASWLDHRWNGIGDWMS
ncbi:MAG: hypothetical protein VX620_15440 [Pseudomonadota bacterium]|nr:hypothetical protein [Pseudomonadota bacterium]